MGRNRGRRQAGKVLVELVNQFVCIHAVHEGSVFQGIEIDRKALAAAHIQIRKKLDGIGIGTDYFIDFSVFFYNHTAPNLLARHIWVC